VVEFSDDEVVDVCLWGLGRVSEDGFSEDGRRDSIFVDWAEGVEFAEDFPSLRRRLGAVLLLCTDTGPLLADFEAWDSTNPLSLRIIVDT
jgi:hypothetical protein